MKAIKQKPTVYGGYEYSMSLISRGSFIDKQSAAEPIYSVEVSTYRLSSGAVNSWLWENPATAEKMARKYLGIPQHTESESVAMTHHQVSDVLTVVRIKKEAS